MNQPDASIVRVTNAGGKTLGTGFLVSTDGRIATCAHVVEGTEPRIAFPGGELRPAQAVATDPVHDVAILKLESNLPPGAEPARLGRSAEGYYSDFRSRGYRSLGEMHGIPAEGRVLHAVTECPGAQYMPLILKSQDIRKGMSGAPVYVPDLDLVVGMITGYWDSLKHQRSSEEEPLFADRDTAFATPTEAITALCPDITLVSPRPPSPPPGAPWTAATAPSQPQLKRYLRMLAVVAAPVVGLTVADPPPAPLDLWAEWRRLEEAVHNAWDVVRGQGTPWAVVRLNPPTRHALADALASGDLHAAYQVVHISGHGTADGLALEDELGCTEPLSGDELVALFRDRPVRLIVLNACRTETLARRLHREAGVPAIVATAESLRNDEACLLSTRLYACLARGRSVAEAFAEANAALRYAYEHSDLPIPPEHDADPESYVAGRLAVPVLVGDARLELPPGSERAAEPFFSLAEPPSRGMDLHLVEGFVGRGPELVQIARWLRGRPSPVIALSGLGGIGKSALAAAAVLRGSWRFRAVLALSARGDPHLRPDALVPPLDGVLGLEGQLAAAPTEAERLARAIDALNRTPVLLMLDNLEDLTPAASRAWAEFLGGLDPRHGSVALLTLRPAVKHPLTDLAGPAHLPLERLGEPDALRLLAGGLTARKLWAKVPSMDVPTLARRARLTALAGRAYLERLPLGHLAALDGMAERAGRHPYTLRLALGDLAYPHVDWARALSNVSDLRGRDWEAQAEVMGGRMVADLARADPEAVALLQVLLVFQGGAPDAALRAVAAPDEDETVFDDRLRAALDASLLEGHGAGEAARYDLHPLTRAYLSRRQPLDAVASSELRRRHAVHFLDWAIQHQRDFDAIEAELPNLRTGFAYATADATRDDAMVQYYGAVLVDMFQTRCYRDEVLAWMGETARACERLGDQNNLAAAYNNMGQAHHARGEYEAALKMYQKAAMVMDEIGERAGLARVYGNMGKVWRHRGEYGVALELYEKAAMILAEIGDWEGLAVVYNNIGLVSRDRGDYGAALEMFERAALVIEEIGDQAGLAMVWNNIGMIHHVRGEYEAALAMLEKAEPVLTKIGDRAGLAEVCNSIGEVYYSREEYEAALKMYQKAALMLAEIGDSAMLARVYGNIGKVYDACGEYKAALEMYKVAGPVLAKIGDRKGLATVYNNIGQVYWAWGEHEAALEMLQKALVLNEELGGQASIAQSQAILGSLHVIRGDYTVALEMFEKAVPVLTEIGDRKMLAVVYGYVGGIHSDRGEYTMALEMFEKAVLG
jgi:tetratricopeptide (TPR) repeat protein